MTKTVSPNLRNEIISVLERWNDTVAVKNDFPATITALNFGLQKVWDGCELYLEGFTWYEDNNNSWLLDVAWSPDHNYITLSSESLGVDILDLLKVYKETINEQIHSANLTFPKHVQMVIVCLSNGKPLRLI